MAKKALKGFAQFGRFPLTKNDATDYTPGTRVPMVGAQSLTTTDNRQEYEIRADDGVYDSGSDFQNVQLQVNLAEMSLADLAAMTGATYTELDKEMDESELDSAPEIALNFSGLRADGGKRLFTYYVAKLTSFKVDLSTRGANNEILPYQLTFKCYGRACDHKVRTTKDVDAAAGVVDTTWLDTIAAVPAA
jgi:phi13 family phage major tail protein